MNQEAIGYIMEQTDNLEGTLAEHITNALPHLGLLQLAAIWELIQAIATDEDVPQASLDEINSNPAPSEYFLSPTNKTDNHLIPGLGLG